MSSLDFDHIVIVVFENHGYREVFGTNTGSSPAPYISQLADEGFCINNAFGEQHPSQPNYFWLFSGSNQGIMDDKSYWPSDDPGPVFGTENLYCALEQRFDGSGLDFFGGYVDPGSDEPLESYYSDTDNYANRHVPWLGFTNINQGNPAEVTRLFNEFPSRTDSDFSQLPVVSMVIPGLNHDMHDYNSSGGAVNNTTESATAVANGDTWLQENLAAYATWAKDNNSLLILTWDEDSSHDWITPVDLGGGGTFKNASGLTNPLLGANSDKHGPSGPNHIAMVFYGANLAMSGHVEVSPSVGVNNVNLLRTIESIYGLDKSGAQSPVAAKAGLTDEAIPGLFIFDY